MLSAGREDTAAIGVGIVDSPDGMQTIAQPGIAAVIWRRQPLKDFQAWMDCIDPARLPQTRLVLRPEAVLEAVMHVLNVSGMPDDQHGETLAEDISMLATTFADVMNTRYLRLRLDVIEDNACRKFHIDHVVARLVCTYRGTGTQYGISVEGRDPVRVFTVPTTAPMIMRGTQWPDAQQSGLVHRSPPIEGTGETRLMLVLDPVADPDDLV